MTLLFIQLSALGLKQIKVENINIEINITNMWFIKNTYAVFSLVANNNAIDIFKMITIIKDNLLILRNLL